MLNKQKIKASVAVDVFFFLGAALISVFVFKEKITRSWYFTIGFSIAAIILNR